MNLSIIVGVCVSALSFICILRWIIRRYYRLQLWKRLNIPGPKPSLLPGNLLQLKSTGNPHIIISNWIKEYGNICGYYLGSTPYIAINDTDILKKILIDDFDNFVNKPVYELDVYPMTKMLIYLKDKRWKEVRALLNKEFKLSKIKNMSISTENKVNTTVNVISRKIKDNKKLLELQHISQAFTLDVIADCVYGMKDDFQAEDNAFLKTVRRIFQLSSHWCLNIIIMFPNCGKLISKLSHIIIPRIKLSDFVIDHVVKCVHNRKKHYVPSTDFLHFMLEHLGNGSPTVNTLTEDEVIGNSYLFLLAGFETTSVTLAHIFYLLAVHPHIQERLYEEVKNVDINFNSIHKLPFLDQVLKETLRLYPPVVDFRTRICKNDYEIANCVIPSGAVIHIPVWHIHHDEKYWQNPWDFIPERFAQGQSINTYAYLPFGSGKRHCIGQTFAEVNIKLLTCQLVQKFQFSKCEKTDHPITSVCPTGVLNPAKGCYLQVEERSS